MAAVVVSCTTYILHSFSPSVSFSDNRTALGVQLHMHTHIHTHLYSR